MSLVELIELLKSILKFFRIFFPSAMIFLVKFDPKVNKKSTMKKAKNDDQKYFFENSETSFVHQISVFY